MVTPSNSDTNFSGVDFDAMAESYGISKEELVRSFIEKASADESTREVALTSTMQVASNMTPEERALTTEIANIEKSAKTNRIFTEPQPIPDAWKPKFAAWHKAGLMPPATAVVAQCWLGTGDRISTEAVFGRHFDGIGNMLTYPSRLSNARRRQFVPSEKKFGATTLSHNGRTTSDVREFLGWYGIAVPLAGSTVSTYLYRACEVTAGLKTGKGLPADVRIHNLAILGCSSDGKSQSLARYFEWFEANRADVSNGVIIGKNGEPIEITDYEAAHPAKAEDLSDDDEEIGDGEDIGDDENA